MEKLLFLSSLNREEQHSKKSAFSKGAQELKPGEGGPLKWLLTCIRSLTGIGSSSHTLSRQPRLEQTEVDAGSLEYTVP